MAQTGSCKLCYYHREVGSSSGVACHRYPPTIIEVVREENKITSYFPLVNNESWCGEFEPILDMALGIVPSTISRPKRRKS